MIDMFTIWMTVTSATFADLVACSVVTATIFYLSIRKEIRSKRS